MINVIKKRNLYMLNEAFSFNNDTTMLFYGIFCIHLLK